MEKFAGEPSHDTLDMSAHVPLDHALYALAHVQRRTLLYALLGQNSQDSSPAILADSEDEADGLEHLVVMNHVHLPKLAEYGFINWNRETDKVAKGPNFDKIKPLLELLTDHEDELPDGWM